MLKLSAVVVVLAIVSLEHGGAFKPAAKAPNRPPRKYDYGSYADGVVRNMLKKEIERSFRIAQAADVKAKNAQAAWYRASQRASAPRSTVEHRHTEVERLKNALHKLHVEKTSAKTQMESSAKKASDANKREETMAVRLSDARQRAADAKKVATARSEEAVRARAAASAAAARAQATDFIPEGFQQTQVAVVGEARRLAEEAEFSENMASRAMAEAKKYEDSMYAAARESTAVWLAASKATEEHKVKEAIYKAKCEAYADTKTAYDKSVMTYEASRTVYNPEGDTLAKAKHDYDAKVVDAAKYWAINKAFRIVFHCSDNLGATRNHVQAGGGDRQRPSPNRGPSRNRVRNGGRSSEERGGRRNGGRSSGQGKRVTGNRVVAGGGPGARPNIAGHKFQTTQVAQRQPHHGQLNRGNYYNHNAQHTQYGYYNNKPGARRAVPKFYYQSPQYQPSVIYYLANGRPRSLGYGGSSEGD